MTSMSLPMASDTMRCEARMIREAAERAAEQMKLVEDATVEVHQKLRDLEEYIKDLGRHGTLDMTIVLELLSKIPTPKY